MNLYRRVSIVVAAAIGIVFALVFAVLVLAAKADRDPFDQLVLVAVGSALLGAGLVVVLVQVLTLLATAPQPTAQRHASVGTPPWGGEMPADDGGVPAATL